jgi:hypothetical protein
VFTCGSAGSIESRKTALSTLKNDLLSINTPVEVIDAIMHGMDMWERSQNHPQLPVHALTAGSLKGSHVLLTAAFTDQFNSIGWQQLLKGRMSHQWELQWLVSEKNQTMLLLIPSGQHRLLPSFGNTSNRNGLIEILWSMIK